MNVVLVYLRMYGSAVATAFKAIGKNPWTLLLPVGLVLAFPFAAALAAPLGLVGGFLLGFAMAAGASAYLYFTGEVVARSATSVRELRKGFGVFFWSVIGFQFVLWIGNWGISAALQGNSKAGVLMGGVYLIEFIALNAAPETIYLKGTRGGVDTVMASFGFLQENWIEWFLPNGLIFGAALWLELFGLPDLRAQVPMVGIVLPLCLGALFHLVMVFRGVLYLALDGSTHRQRMYKYRTDA